MRKKDLLGFNNEIDDEDELLYNRSLNLFKLVI